MSKKSIPTTVTGTKKRRNKDKEIEALEARNEYLENKLKAMTSIRTLKKKEKKALALVLSLSILLLVLVFAFAALKSHTISAISEEDYARIISEIDGKKWQCSESTREDMKYLLPSASGIAYSYVEGENLTLRFPSGDNVSSSFVFAFASGRIFTFFRGVSIDLEFSRTVTGGGKTLTLVYGDRKIVLSAQK